MKQTLNQFWGDFYQAQGGLDKLPSGDEKSIKEFKPEKAKGFLIKANNACEEEKPDSMVWHLVMRARTLIQEVLTYRPYVPTIPPPPRVPQFELWEQLDLPLNK